MPYESDADLEQYLLLHFGEPKQVCPLSAELAAYASFPKRVVEATLAHVSLQGKSRALDLGCSVGRSSFELARTFGQVIGIDLSQRFIGAARIIQTVRSVLLPAHREGYVVDSVSLNLPASIPAERVSFEVGDACQLRSDLGQFDLVLLSNLIDRVPNPAACLADMARLVTPGGWLAIASPYNWNEAFTRQENWLCSNEGSLPVLTQHLKAFSLKNTQDIPLLIRRDQRTFLFSIAELSVWQRRAE